MPLSSQKSAQWRALLEGIGFACEVYPMNAGTPFASMMLRAKKRPQLSQS
ncbi:MAG: hypothetical protein Q4A11_00805 [Brachymonas sp.]|nr:hypothetical protein [Brachymonas sp.]